MRRDTSDACGWSGRSVRFAVLPVVASTLLLLSGFDDDIACAACGDGVTDMGEACDDGNAINDDGCDSNCTFTACGNGIVTSSEQCDDGNLAPGDGCDASCTIELGATELLPGTKLLLGDYADISHRRLKVESFDPTLTIGGGDGTIDDPVVTPGSSLRVLTADGCAGPCDTTYLLSETWSYMGLAGDNAGYQFRHRAGPIRSVRIEPGRRIKIIGKGRLRHALAANPSPVDIVLTVGAKRYCLEFGGDALFVVNDFFKATLADPPAACP